MVGWPGLTVSLEAAPHISRIQCMEPPPTRADIAVPGARATNI
jgi:hypothetical protein